MRSLAQLSKNEAGNEAHGWRARDLANVPLQGFAALAGFLETYLQKAMSMSGPNAVAPLLKRLWSGARGHEADDWCSNRAGFWDTALRGRSALRAGIQRMLMNETDQLLQYRFAMVCRDLEKFYDSICLHWLLTSMVSMSFPPAIIVLADTMYLSPRFLRGLGSVALPTNSILQGCGFACHFARGLLHCPLDHVRRLYPVELTEFVDDITHKVEGARDAVMRVFLQSGEHVAREMRA